MPDRSCLRLPLAPTAIGAGDCLVLMRDQARARNQVQRLSQSQSYNTHPCPCITSGHTFSMHTFSMHTFSMHTFSMHSIKSICLTVSCRCLSAFIPDSFTFKHYKATRLQVFWIKRWILIIESSFKI